MKACSLRVPEYTCAQQAGPASLSAPECSCKPALPDAVLAVGRPVPSCWPIKLLGVHAADGTGCTGDCRLLQMPSLPHEKQLYHCWLDAHLLCARLGCNGKYDVAATVLAAIKLLSQIRLQPVSAGPGAPALPKLRPLHPGAKAIWQARRLRYATSLCWPHHAIWAIMLMWSVMHSPVCT